MKNLLSAVKTGFNKAVDFVCKSKNALIGVATTGAALATAGVARAEGEVAAMVTAMPSVDLSLVTSAGGKVFACIAVVVAIGLGFRLFKKA